MKQGVDKLVIAQLQKQILDLQGQRPSAEGALKIPGFGFIEEAFPEKVFPKAATHELVSYSSEDAACTSGFLAVLLGKLMGSGGSCLWISTIPRRSMFPPALKNFGIDAERILFVDARKPKETLWAVEEALKCSALNGVVGELNELSFNESRRLQLVVEKSGVPGFIHRFRPGSENPVACVSRWKITPLPSELPNGLPGVGFARWNIMLQKVKNGLPREWQVQWSDKGLEYLQPDLSILQKYARNTG